MKHGFYRPDLRTQAGFVAGVIGMLCYVVGAFLPVMTMEGESIASFGYNKEGGGDWILLLIAGALGGLWAYVGRRSLQTNATLLGLMATVGFYLMNKQRFELMSALIEGVDELNEHISGPSFGMGFWLVLIGAIAFGDSSMTNRDPKKMRRA